LRDFVLIWFGAALCCTAADQRILRVCADPNNLPFSNRTEEGLENKLARLIAHDLSSHLKYIWFSERKNFLKNSLNANLCDAILGVPVDMEGALLTRPYYRSTYVVVTRADRKLKIDSLYDPCLRDLRIGIHMVGGDYSPPGHLLAAQGLSGQIGGYSLYGAYGETNPPARLSATLSSENNVSASGPEPSPSLSIHWARRARSTPSMTVTPARRQRRRRS